MPNAEHIHIIVDDGEKYSNFLVTPDELTRLYLLDDIGQVLVIDPTPEIKTEGEIRNWFKLDNIKK